jgi:hypothetical protein
MDDPLIEEITINGSRVHVYRDGQKELVEHLVPDPAETRHQYSVGRESRRNPRGCEQVARSCVGCAAKSW